MGQWECSMLNPCWSIPKLSPVLLAVNVDRVARRRLSSQISAANQEVVLFLKQLHRTYNLPGLSPLSTGWKPVPLFQIWNQKHSMNPTPAVPGTSNGCIFGGRRTLRRKLFNRRPKQLWGGLGRSLHGVWPAYNDSRLHDVEKKSLPDKRFFWLVFLVLAFFANQDLTCGA